MKAGSAWALTTTPRPSRRGRFDAGGSTWAAGLSRRHIASHHRCTEKEARRKLRARIKEAQGDRFVGFEQERLSIGDLLDALEAHLEIRRASSLATVRSHMRPVRVCLGMSRAVDLTTAAVEAFTAQRLRDGKAPAT